MKKYFTIDFWNYSGERALKTLIQALFAAGLIGNGLFDIDWAQLWSLAFGTALASVATSILFYKGDGTDNPDDLSIGKHS